MAFGWYPIDEPSSVRSCHHFCKACNLPAAVASSANHTCFTAGSFSRSFLISGVTARAYIAIARGSPWVVPSVDSISPLPITYSFTGARYVLLRTQAIGGHSLSMLYSAALRLMVLKHLLHRLKGLHQCPLERIWSS